jgi:hypothetical protein
MPKPPEQEDPDVQLGRNLAAAYIAGSHGIGLDYARKKYAGQPVGNYWVELARKIAADVHQRHEGVLPPATFRVQ